MLLKAYSLVGFTVSLSFALLLFANMILNYSTGIVTIDFNSFGEFRFEFWMIASTLPGFLLAFIHAVKDYYKNLEGHDGS